MPDAAALSLYIETLRDAGSAARRSALRRLLEASGDRLHIDESPRRAAAGGPDFVLIRGGQPVGWVFVTDSPDSHLDRWRDVLPNVLITDCAAFQRTADGAAVQTAHIGAWHEGRLERARDTESVAALLQRFAGWTAPPTAASADLAVSAARLAHELRAVLLTCISADAPDSLLLDYLQAFRSILLPALTLEDFADSCSQMFVFGLLAARLRHRGAARQQPFTRGDTQWDLPPTSPLLRELFRQTGGNALDARAAWLVDALAALFDRADTDAIMREFSQRARREDPVTPFYTLFMQHYDPQRQPVHTPEALAGYVVRSIDHLLRKRFKQGLGLADEDVRVLDPATGAGTFLFMVIEQVYATMFQQRQLGGWDDYVSDYLLPRICGFEQRLAPYALAQLKLGLELDATGYDFASARRLNLFLANALADPTTAPAPASASARARVDAQGQAHAIRHEQPVTVVVSRPPFGTSGQQPGAWLVQLIRSAYWPQDDAEERGWPQDDYISFMRLAHWRIEQTGSGIAALVTPTGYLDDPALATMRRSLMTAFSDIYILNLRGARRDGTPDEGLFDTPHGAVAGIFVRRPGWTRGDLAHVRYADLRGTRADKLAWLKASDLNTTSWQDVAPLAPHYRFTPPRTDLRGEFEMGWHLSDIFPLRAPGFRSHPDAPAAAFDRETLRRRTAEYTGHPVADSDLIPCLYGAFDERWACLDARVVAAAPRDLVPHVTGRDTPALAAADSAANPTHPLAWATMQLIPADLLGAESAAHLFPIYVYPDQVEDDYSPFPPGSDNRRPNLHPAFVVEIAGRLAMTFIPDGRGDLKDTFGPEDVFDYAYAVFHSPAYRARYAEFLKTDFPRLPLTGSKKLFRALARKGRDLADRHLLRRADSWPLITGFSGSGPNIIDSGFPRYIELAGERPRVHINRDKYFEGIPREVWQFQVGGYQVLHKWLKNRQGRALDWHDLRHYQQIVVALRDTLTLMTEIDALLTTWPLV